MRRAATEAAGFLLPPACESCLRLSERRRWICESCLVQLQRIERAPACEQCGYPLALWGDPCPQCLGRGRRPLRSILRLGRYEPPLQGLIHALKYRGRWTLACELAERLLARPGAQELLEGADALVPVPLHWRRRWQRGFNQSELLCQRLSELMKRPVLPALRRCRDTPSQTTLHSVTARLRNLRGAFELQRGVPVAGARLVLVDDVLTTGATLRSAAKVLQRAKAKSLDAMVLAIADPGGRNFEAV
jgi:ComF family protein